jgi:hypothetical protein
MSRLVVAVLIGLVATTSASAATRPKPWQWTTGKAATRLAAADPFNAPADELGDDVLSARCVGKGRSVSARFSAFLCEARIGGSNGALIWPVLIRVLPVGSGKICVVTGPDGLSLPREPVRPGGIPGGYPVATGRACP